MNIAAFSQQETMKLKENDVCIYITESLGCRAEIITTIVNQLYLNKTWKNEKKNREMLLIVLQILGKNGKWDLNFDLFTFRS